MNEDKKYDLEDRLIDFAVMILDGAERLPNTQPGNYVSGSDQWEKHFNRPEKHPLIRVGNH